MKLKGLLIGMLTSMLTLVGCDKTIIIPFAVINNDKQVNEYTLPQNEQGEFGIFFGNYTYDGKTKAASENGVLVGPSNCGYDRFNIYAWKDNEITTMNPYLVRYETNNWAYDGINSQEMQYFARGSQQYGFTGVISNGTETVDGINVNVTGVKAFLDNTLELDTPDEFLFSNVSVDKNNYGSIVPIVFNHVNSKMYIGFASDRDDTEILDYVPGTPEIPATDDIEEITDTWFNLKRGSNVDGSPTKLKGQVKLPIPTMRHFLKHCLLKLNLTIQLMGVKREIII